MTQPNTELAYHILDLTRKHWAHLNMGFWSYSEDVDQVTLDDLTADAPIVDNDSGRPLCGTTACFAGWTAAHAGYQLVGEDVYENGERTGRSVRGVATELLGLPLPTATRLFVCEEEHLEATVLKIFGPRPEVTP